jgi:hypothetical protein
VSPEDAVDVLVVEMQTGSDSRRLAAAVNVLEKAAV